MSMQAFSSTTETGTVPIVIHSTDRQWEISSILIIPDVADAGVYVNRDRLRIAQPDAKMLFTFDFLVPGEVR